MNVDQVTVKPTFTSLIHVVSGLGRWVLGLVCVGVGGCYGSVLPMGNTRQREFGDLRQSKRHLTFQKNKFSFRARRPCLMLGAWGSLGEEGACSSEPLGLVLQERDLRPGSGFRLVFLRQPGGPPPKPKKKQKKRQKKKTKKTKEQTNKFGWFSLKANQKRKGQPKPKSHPRMVLGKPQKGRRFLRMSGL